MILRRIEVRNFRKLLEPLVVEGLGPGVTLIAGDNEDGKSTLVEAIRTAFFVKHNISGEFADAMQPYNSNVRPEVRIEFELDEQIYRLFKAYCQRSQAELVTPTGTFNGSAAEEELSRLLRFSLSKRIRKDDQHEHEGVFAMFWVEQGKSLVPEPNVAGRTSILEALQKEVGDVLGGRRGQRLIAEVSRRREELLTATGKPRGAYAAATQAILDLGTDLAAVEGQLANHSYATKELELCLGRVDQYRREGALETARERVHVAKRASEKVVGLQAAFRDADLTLQTAKARYQSAADRAGQRAQLVEILGLADAGLKKLVELMEAERNRVSGSRGKLESKEQALADAQTELMLVEQELKRAEAADRLAIAHTRLARLQQDHAATLAANEERESALVVTTGIKIEKPNVNQLRRLQEAVTSARARLESVATQIEMSVVPGANVLLGNEPVVGEQRRTLTRATVIEAPGSMRLSIFPGAAVGNPQAELEAANHDLDVMLQRLGATSLADAEDQFERRTAALSRAVASARVVAAHAPQGLEELSLQIAATASEVQALDLFVGTNSDIEAADLSANVETLRQRHAKLKDAVDATRRQVEQARSELNEAINTETAAAAKHSHQQALCIQYRERLASERVLVSDEELGATLLQATQEANLAEIALAASRRALDEADPEAIAQDLRMATAAHQQIETDIAGLREKAIRLQSELRVSGGLGLGERRDELQALLAAAHTEAGRIERQAKTLDLLLRVLLDAESAAKEQFLRPVTERVQAYLKILLPGTELAFDENISIVGLRRDATVEPFQSLSVGTREQLAVLTRLAFAELLQEHGHPAVVLLDDAIVFADDERFDRMLRILDKAAEKLQVIVFTCRELDYRPLGAPIIRLADCSVRTAAAS
jgi:DNA repair exonuclease SbcCD ATPase subunit